MNRFSIPWSAIATTIAAAAIITPTPAFANRTGTDLYPVKISESALELTSGTPEEIADSAVTTAQEDAIGLPRQSLEQIAEALQVNQNSNNESVISRFNANKPASANGIVYQFE